MLQAAVIIEGRGNVLDVTYVYAPIGDPNNQVSKNYGHVEKKEFFYQFLISFPVSGIFVCCWTEHNFGL